MMDINNVSVIFPETQGRSLATPLKNTAGLYYTVAFEPILAWRVRVENDPLCAWAEYETFPILVGGALVPDDYILKDIEGYKRPLRNLRYDCMNDLLADLNTPA